MGKSKNKNEKSGKQYLVPESAKSDESTDGFTVPVERKKKSIDVVPYDENHHMGLYKAVDIPIIIKQNGEKVLCIGILKNNIISPLTFEEIKWCDGFDLPVENRNAIYKYYFSKIFGSESVRNSHPLISQLPRELLGEIEKEF